LGGWLGFGAVALVVLGGAPDQSFADSGETSGGSVGAAESHGSGFTKAEFGGKTISRASEECDKKSVSAETASEGHAKSYGLSKHGVSHAKVKTYASASASKHKKTLTAHAVAGVAVAAGAADGSGHALVLSSGGSLAFAQSGKTLSAYALSGTGASALAESHGKKVYTSSSVEGGTTSTFKEGQWNYTISYNTTGAFAIAMSSKKSVGAIAGTTTEAGALASGNLGAFLQSSTFASAYASPGMASAYAEALGFGSAGGKFGYSSAFSSSWASASVTSGDDEEEALMSSGSKGCASGQWLKKAKFTQHCNIEF
jgi:hypothetical protein